MTVDDNNKKDVLSCSFCGKTQREVKKLIAGPGVNICDECVALCSSVVESELSNNDFDFSKLDIVLLGGGSDREQAIVCKSLLEIQSEFKDYVEDGGVVIAVCGGYQLLGKYYKTDAGMIEGLNLVDIYTEQEEGRLIDNIVLDSDLVDMPVVGFENHGGRTYLNGNKPFGKVLYGAGNDGKSGYEGVVYKNVIGTYLHGPLLPKNPQVSDYLIQKALERKYGEVQLMPLDDSQEKEANDYIYHRFVK